MKVRHPCSVGGYDTCEERQSLVRIGYNSFGPLHQCKTCHSLVAKKELGEAGRADDEYLWRKGR